jgi:hypothetical protein
MMRRVSAALWEGAKEGGVWEARFWTSRAVLIGLEERET